MKVEQFLEVMKANAEMFSEFDALPDEQKRFLAEINIASGLARSYFEDGKLIGVFGIRYVGLGEVWGIGIPELKERKHLLLKLAKESFDKAVKDLNLWRVFACPSMSKNFVEHLGFEKPETVMTWTKRE